MTAGSGPEPPLPDAWGQIPDDASALEADRQAWLAEQRLLRRRSRTRSVQGLTVVLAVAIALTVTAMVVMLMPGRATVTDASAPLADVPVLPAPSSTAPPGASGSPSPSPSPSSPSSSSSSSLTALAGPVQVEGYRLPDVPLVGQKGLLTTSDLRPAVIAIVPAECGCTRVLHEIYVQAREFRVALWVVGSGGQVTPEELNQLIQDAGAGHPTWAIDAQAALDAVLGSTGLTVLVIRPDGVITGIRRDVSLDPAQLPALEPLLARLTSSNR